MWCRYHLLNSSEDVLCQFLQLGPNILYLFFQYFEHIKVYILGPLLAKFWMRAAPFISALATGLTELSSARRLAVQIPSNVDI
jgi:hypothetical protein